LSYPYEHGFSNGEEVPTWLAGVISIPVVMILLVLIRFVATHFMKLHRDKNLHPKTLNIFVVQLVFLEAISLALGTAECVKKFVGRKRPNFFAMCDYQGYREALATNNFTSYLQLTQANIPGNIANCRGEVSEINESQYSFPSGHSTAIWCGMTFLCLYALYLFHHFSSRYNMAKGLLALLFFTTATLIACTRPRDYWHNFDDIVAGSVIGFSCSCFCFFLNYSGILTQGSNENEEKAGLMSI